MGTPLWWTLFLAVTVAVIALDLAVASRRPMTQRSALGWTALWVSLSLALGAAIFWREGAHAAVPFFTAYAIEYALSVDNLFVFLVLFSYFRVSTAAQHRLLRWGIIGAFSLRGVLIVAGTTLVARFEWLLYVFGAFLLYTAWKLLFGAEGEGVAPEANPILKLARRVLRVGPQDPSGLAFAVREGGRWQATPLFLVLVVVEATDVLFALDSIPAVLGVSQDPFIVFTSNACAILGLRSLFFVIAGMMDRFRFLKTGLGAILAFVGLKLVLEQAFPEWADAHDGAIIGGSLAYIVTALTASVVASLLVPPRAPASSAEVPEAQPSPSPPRDRSGDEHV